MDGGQALEGVDREFDGFDGRRGRFALGVVGIEGEEFEDGVLAVARPVLEQVAEVGGGAGEAGDGVEVGHH